MPGVDTDSRPPLWLSLGIASACGIALADWPYGYYQLLRLAVTAYAAWIAWLALEENRTKWACAFGFLAILYNPFFKIALDRETWSFVNLGTAAIIVAEFWRFRHIKDRKRTDRES